MLQLLIITMIHISSKIMFKLSELWSLKGFFIEINRRVQVVEAKSVYSFHLRFSGFVFVP